MKRLGPLVYLLIALGLTCYGNPDITTAKAAIPGNWIALTNETRSSSIDTDGDHHLTIPEQTGLSITMSHNVVDGNLNSVMKMVNDRSLWRHTASIYLTTEGNPPTVTTATDSEIPFAQLMNICFNKLVVDKVIDHYMPPFVKKIRTANIIGF